MKNEDLLIEIEDLLRNVPNAAKITHDLDENYSWFGRVAAVLNAWNSGKAVSLPFFMSEITGVNALNPKVGFGKIKTLLHEARHDLRMKTVGSVSIAVQKGMVFDYFDEIRKAISIADTDILFIDPYLDAEFVSRYISNCPQNVTIRLLSEKKLLTLLPAVDSFNQQHQTKIQVRSTTGIHDRHLIIDGKICYQSGASFKDGAKASPTTLTQITDAFSAVKLTYEGLWASAKIERP
jgi:hypothetical protein